MEQEQTSKIERWLKQLFGDIGNLAVAIHSMGRFKPTVEAEADQEEDNANSGEKPEEKPAKVLHPSMIKLKPGQFFTPSRYKRD